MCPAAERLIPVCVCVCVCLCVCVCVCVHGGLLSVLLPIMFAEERKLMCHNYVLPSSTT